MQNNTEKAVEGLESFIPGFYKDRVADYEQLKGFYEKKSYEDIKKLAHRWKGFCDPYGFGKLTIISKSLEEECEKHNIDQGTVQKLINEVKDYLEIKGKEIEG